jgi:HEAT repeat protein
MSNCTRRSLRFVVLVTVCCTASFSLSGCGKPPELLSVSGKLIEFWLEALKAPNTDVKQRLKAVQALSNVGAAHPQAIPALIDALEQTDPELRVAVVLALLKIGPAAKEALPALERISQSDKETKVRDFAQKAVNAINSR